MSAGGGGEWNEVSLTILNYRNAQRAAVCTSSRAVRDQFRPAHLESTLRVGKGGDSRRQSALDMLSKVC